MTELEKLAQAIVSFRSTHNNQVGMQACLDYCINFFEDLPVIVKKYESNGVVSVVISNADTLEFDVMLLGHIDVADGPEKLFDLHFTDGNIYGRGTSDMKAFVATSLIVLRDLIKNGYSGKIGLAIVTDEELGGGNGARYLVETIGYKPRVVLVPDDGDDISTIVTESKHMFSFLFTAHGKSAHGNRPWDGVNAIELLLKTLSNLRKTFPEYTAKPTSNWVNTLNLGIINGGLAGNEVPAEASMKIDIRIVPPTTKEEVLIAINNSVVEGVTFDLVMEGYPTAISKTNPYFIAYCDSIKKFIDSEIKYKQSGGGTDARYFSEQGIPVIVHQGTCGDAQGENEYANLQSMQQLIDIQKDFILSLKLDI